MDSLFEYASYLSDETKWHGNHDENERGLTLKAGHLSMVYENGNLCNISIGNREVIRRIYSAVRDKKWLTIKGVISQEEFDLNPDSFIIRYNCEYRSQEINFLARYIIEGRTDNSLVFNFEGEVINGFERNRIGFCVLHPVEGYSDNVCLITHSNDEVETLRFPGNISPHQPFMDIKSMKWQFFNHVCTVNFSGDIFETEDQRNWTDASYKTYCTPINIPYPVKLEKGSRISQRIEFKAEAKVELEVEVELEKSDNKPILINVYPEQMISLPEIGIGRSTRKIPLTDSEIQILSRLRFDHYRVDLSLFSNEWKQVAGIVTSEAEKLAYPLEIALFFDDNFEDQVAEFISWIKNKKTKIVLIGLFHKSCSSTPNSVSSKISPLLKKALPDVKIGCGTNANFAQLNRNRPESIHNDYICYSIHPQEHVSDNTTLVENLQAQVCTVESAMQFANGKKIWISPVTIQRRFNANIENYEHPSTGVEIPPQVDSRIMSLFGACWSVGSLKYLSEAGARGLTFFETVGERGIIQGDFPSRWPEGFPAISGMIFPIYFFFKYLLKNKSFKVIKSVCSNPLKVDSLILSDGNQIKLILVNFTSSLQQVIIDGCSGRVTIKQLNSETFADAVSDLDWDDNTYPATVNPGENLVLSPFSVSFIDGWLNL